MNRIQLNFIFDQCEIFERQTRISLMIICSLSRFFDFISVSAEKPWSQRTNGNNNSIALLLNRGNLLFKDVQNSDSFFCKDSFENQIISQINQVFLKLLFKIDGFTLRKWVDNPFHFSNVAIGKVLKK